MGRSFARDPLRVRHRTVDALRTLANTPLALQTAGHGLEEDPFEFLIQVRRKLSPAAASLLVKVASFGRAGPPREAFLSWFRDEPERARAILSSADIEWGTFTRLLAAHLELTERSWSLPAPIDLPPTPRKEPRRIRPLRKQISVFHLLTNSLPHTNSGYSLRSHNVLLAQQRAGIRVAAATRLGYPVSVGSITASKSSHVDGITYHRLLPSILKRSLEARIDQATRLLIPIVEAFDADVLSTTTDYTNALVAERVASALGIPWTYEVRGLPEDSWVSRRYSAALQCAAKQSPRYAIDQMRETNSAMRSHHVFALGDALRTEFTERGVRSDNITTVNNAAPGHIPTRLPSSQARASLGLPQRGFWVGSISSLVVYEGFDTLIRAVHLARERGYDIRLLLVGGGVAKPELERLTRALGLELGTDVIFTSKVSTNVARRYYQTLDLFAVPRRDFRVCRLVQPLKPLEACAAGVPMIVSDLPALRTFADGAGAITVAADDVNAWADSLCSLASAPERLKESARKAQIFAESSTWEREGAKYLSSYRQILSETLSA